MDFTGSQMIVTLKIISAAVTYQDGLKPEKVLMTYTPKAVTSVYSIWRTLGRADYVRLSSRCLPAGAHPISADAQTARHAKLARVPQLCVCLRQPAGRPQHRAV